VGSGRYRAFEERLISRETLKELELAATDIKARGGLLCNSSNLI
jgi:hypothetical protein